MFGYPYNPGILLHGAEGQKWHLAGITVDDAKEAYDVATANGAVGVQPPTVLTDDGGNGSTTVSEVVAYGDCVLRFVSGDFKVGPVNCAALHTCVELS